MTSTTENNEVLKQDRRGRVWVPRERREALLAEFARSGLSGAQFARMAGIKYATFANWVQKQRAQKSSAAVGGGSVRLVEAIVEEAGARAREGRSAGLWVELPGGSRVQVASPVQLAMVAELIKLVAQGGRAC